LTNRPIRDVARHPRCHLFHGQRFNQVALTGRTPTGRVGTRAIRHHAPDEDAGRDDRFRIEAAGFDHLVHVATVIFAAVAMIGPKLRAVLR